MTPSRGAPNVCLLITGSGFKSQTAHHFSSRLRLFVQIVLMIALDCADSSRCDDHSSIIVKDTGIERIDDLTESSCPSSKIVSVSRVG
jgi:hypothetical protein